MWVSVAHPVQPGLRQGVGAAPVVRDLVTLLRSSPWATARELAGAFSATGGTVTKGQINNVLYSHPREFKRDGGTPPRWNLIGEATKAHSPVSQTPKGVPSPASPSSRPATPDFSAELERLLSEARRHGIVPPTNPKKLAALASTYDLVAIAGLRPEQRAAAAATCKRLGVGGMAVWLSECLAAGRGAAKALDDNARRRAQVQRAKSQITSRLQRVSSTGKPKATVRKREREPSLDWLPDDVPSTASPARLPTGDGPRTRPRMGIARSGF